jgi:hypothetical protein
MNRDTVFSQLLQLICRYRFKKSVDQYEGDKYTKRFSCWQQLIVLLFAQAKSLSSLRDIELSLRSRTKKWYHLGLTNVARSTLSDANNNRSADIFRDTFYSLLEKCREFSPRMVSGLRIPCIRLIQRLLKCVCLCIPGQRTARRKARSNYTHCWTIADICPRSW